MKLNEVLVLPVERELSKLIDQFFEVTQDGSLDDAKLQEISDISSMLKDLMPSLRGTSAWNDPETRGTVRLIHSIANRKR